MLGRPALSCTHQPAFRRLVERAIGARRIVLLCGAGVTVDAGLPTWPELLDRLAADRVARGDPLARLVPLNEPDPGRAAGLLLRRREGVLVPDYAAVAAALYGGGRPPPSTFLAQRLIGLVAARGHRAIAVATTNFDDSLERAAAVAGYVPRPCTLDDADAWWAALATPADPVLPVHHLHGFLGRDRVLGPVVLAEDQFHRQGERVRAELARMAREADLVVAIGTGLADPDLVGALAALRGTPSAPVVAVTVPGPVAGATGVVEAERYTAERAAYLHDVLGVDVVTVAGPAQVGQLVVELELALSEPQRYLAPGPGIRHGHRLARALATAHAAVGWPVDGSEPTGPALQAGSDALQGVLDAVRPALDAVVLDCGHDELLAGEATTDLTAHVAGEHLALALWMPALARPGASHAPQRPRLHLVASSAVVPRTARGRPSLAVDAAATSPAAMAAHRGQPVIGPGPPVPVPGGPVRTEIAIPLDVLPAGEEATVALGVVVVGSDRARDGAPRAGIALLSPGEAAAWCRIVLDAVAGLLAGPTGP